MVNPFGDQAFGAQGNGRDEAGRNETGSNAGDGFFHEAPPSGAQGFASEPFDEPERLNPRFSEAPSEARRLDMGEPEVRLPWLEGDDEDEDDERGGLSAQGLVLIGLGLVAVIAIIGAVIWATRGHGDQELVAVGGVIEAPKMPYKVRPDDPGGQVVDGTGDSSFAVAEGQSRPARIDAMNGDGGNAAAPAQPGFDSVGAKPGAAASPSPTASATPALTGVGVQVGAYANTAAAEAGWAVLKKRYDGLSAFQHRVVQGTADIGTVYRLQAVTENAAAARTLCEGLQQADIPCQVKN
ncbi:SPOR domain-containing protein [Novosphingobium sp. 9]|uniref:SPOR domain-containing protein n=1 Tax=Novosphingobium sp. 9 TaxID=2025349 RepID=UPI0021B546C6|nr:SPOR domain-containing protein [Novosphingobium sp. 9]